MNRCNGFTLIEMMISMVIGVIVVGIGTGVAVNETRSNVAEEYRTQVAHHSRNLHKLLRRDILQAGNSAINWDSLTATEAIGDTLIIRFSESDSVKYFLDANRMIRNGAGIAGNVQSFVPEILPSGAVQISIDVGAPNAHRWLNGGALYHRQHRWIVVPRIFYYNTR